MKGGLFLSFCILIAIITITGSQLVKEFVGFMGFVVLLFSIFGTVAFFCEDKEKQEKITTILFNHYPFIEACLSSVVILVITVYFFHLQFTFAFFFWGSLLSLKTFLFDPVIGHPLSFKSKNSKNTLK